MDCGMCSHCCGWWGCILWGLGWWLAASGLLLFTWNKVIAALWTVKQVKFWHALVVVLTLAVLCGPMCRGGGMNCGDCCGSYGHCGSGCGGCGYDHCKDWGAPGDSLGYKGH